MVDIDRRGHDGFWVELADLNNLADLGDDGRRSGGHHRSKVARRLSVDEIPHSVGAVGGYKSHIGADGILEHVGAPVDLAGLLALRQRRTAPVGQKNAPIPAPAARIRSARLPCGTSSRSIFPARYRPSNTHESVCRGNEQIILRTRPREERGQTGVTVARVVVHDGEIGGALPDQGVDQLDGRPGHAEAADEHRRSVRYVATTSSGPGSPSKKTIFVTRLSSTTASAWPTPMQIAATPTGHRTLGAGEQGSPGSGRPTRRTGGRSRSPRPWR